MDYIQSSLGIGGNENLPEKKFRNARSKGYICQCCKQYVKEYSRRFNSNMSVAILALYKHKVFGFVKVEEWLLAHGYKRCGDFSYMTNYKLIEKQEGKREDGSSKNGFYKLTALGIMFCEMKLKVKSNFIIYNNKLQGFEGEDITIKDALGRKFDYEKLMAE